MSAQQAARRRKVPNFGQGLLVAGTQAAGFVSVTGKR
jgi:hypothetical protein